MVQAPRTAEDALAVLRHLSPKEKRRFLVAVVAEPEAADLIMPAHWLTYAEAAALLGTSKSKICRDASKGRLRSRGAPGTHARMVFADDVFQAVLRLIKEQLLRQNESYSEEIAREAGWFVPKKPELWDLIRCIFPEKSHKEAAEFLKSEARCHLEVKRLRSQLGQTDEGKYSNKYFCLCSLEAALLRRLETAHQKRRKREAAARNSLK